MINRELIGTTGKLVDLFEKELTQEDWDALCTIHRLTKRLGVSVSFKWSKSIDVRGGGYSQIIDESVFLNRESNSDTVLRSKQSVVQMLKSMTADERVDVFDEFCTYCGCIETKCYCTPNYDV